MTVLVASLPIPVPITVAEAIVHLLLHTFLTCVYWQSIFFNIEGCYFAQWESCFLSAADPLFNLPRNSADHITQISIRYMSIFQDFSSCLTLPSISHNQKQWPMMGMLKQFCEKQWHVRRLWRMSWMDKQQWRILVENSESLVLCRLRQATIFSNWNNDSINEVHTKVEI